MFNIWKDLERRQFADVLDCESKHDNLASKLTSK